MSPRSTSAPNRALVGVGASGSSSGSSPVSPITVALCEGHGVLRRRLMVSLEREGDISVIAEAVLPSELGPVVGTITPTVLTVDMSAPTISVSSHTHRCPLSESSSTMNSRVGCAIALMIFALAS